MEVENGGCVDKSGEWMGVKLERGGWVTGMMGEFKDRKAMSGWMENRCSSDRSGENVGEVMGGWVSVRMETNGWVCGGKEWLGKFSSGINCR